MTSIPDPPEPIGPSTSERAGADAEQPPNGGRVVGVILGVVIASALAMATFIWYRWQAVTEPTTAVIVEGDAGLAGARITVRGTPTPITTTLTESNNYIAPVMLEPGLYNVMVELNGRSLEYRHVNVKRFVFLRLDAAEDAAKHWHRPSTLPTSASDP